MGTEPRQTSHRTRVPLLALVGANAVSMVGNVLANIAVPWFVLQTTGSAARTGVVAFFAVLPAIVAGFLGGTVVDRLGYKRTSVIADLASGITVAAIPLLYAHGTLEFWILLALVFLGALLDAPGTTARSALVPDVAGLAGTRLERASATMQAVQRGSLLLGAPLAGLLVTLIGTHNVLWLNAASFAVSAAMVALAVPSPAADSVDTGEEQPSGTYLGELLDGLRFIRRDRLVLTLVLTVMLTNFLDAPLFSVVMPVYAARAFGSAVDLGLMVAAFGGGSLVGVVLYGVVGHKLSRRAAFAGAFVLAGLPFWALAMLPGLPVTVGALALSGLAAGPLNPIIQTVGYERIPAHMRGRVFGAVTAGAYVAMPLGVLVAGYALERIGISATLIAVAACYLVVTASLFLNPALREMDSLTTEEAETVSVAMPSQEQGSIVTDAGASTGNDIP
ncbi:MAG: MFS transporter [Chloroflexota bacterium]|nr:MFS transporter [Chloroflexota bacterium]